MKIKLAKPPKFRPDKGQMKQMREVYDFYMGIATRDGFTEKTFDAVVVGLVRKLFEANHAKNYYKTELRNRVAATATPEPRNT